MTREEALALTKMMGIPESLADAFPMSWSDFADRLSKAMVTRPKHRDWTRALARHTLGLPPQMRQTCHHEVSDAAIRAILQQVPVDYGAAVMQGLSSSIMVGLQHLDISQYPQV